jgi:hypothetical protein
MASSRYVYWRDPTGRPYKGTDNRYAPCTLLSEIGKIAKIGADGNISWQSFSILSLRNVVVGSIAIMASKRLELNSYDSRSIVEAAINTIIKKSGGDIAVEPADLIREANKEAGKFFRKQDEKYVLVTSLSVRSLPVRTLSIENCKIEPISDRNRYAIPKALQYEAVAKTRKSKVGRKKYQLIRVRTSGQSIQEAAHRALGSLAYLRGLWNLAITYGSWSMSLRSRKEKPLGLIQVGPIHTLHHMDGSPVDDVYWYETQFHEEHDLYSPKQGWSKIEKTRKWAMRRIRKLLYGNELRDLIIRYAGALGSADWDSAFLQMWSILESLTATVGTGYEKTVRRASWPYSNRKRVEELVEYLRRCRNQYVHAARRNDDSQNVAQLLKSIVDQHLISLLHNHFEVCSLEEYGACLEFPRAVDKLQQRQRSLRAVSRFLAANRQESGRSEPVAKAD